MEIFGREYDAESERQKGVEEFYRLQHINQTYDFVSKSHVSFSPIMCLLGDFKRRKCNADGNPIC